MGRRCCAGRRRPTRSRGRARCSSTSAAAGVNRADLLQRQGHYPPPPGASEIIGLECSGHVAALGEGVTGWQVGDEVCALLAGGGYAEQVVVPAPQLLPVPDGVDLVTAAGLPEVACTVWSNVVMTARLAAGETFLVQGGTRRHRHARDPGGEGARGAGRGHGRCRRTGWTSAASWAPTSSIDYHDDVPALRGTDGHGADVILDNMGAAGLAANVDALAPDGRLRHHRHAGRHEGRAEHRHAAAQARQRHRDEPARAAGGGHGKGAIVAAVREHVWPMIADGRVRPIVHADVPMYRGGRRARAVRRGRRRSAKVLLRRGDRAADTVRGTTDDGQPGDVQSASQTARTASSR